MIRYHKWTDESQEIRLSRPVHVGLTVIVFNLNHVKNYLCRFNNVLVFIIASLILIVAKRLIGGQTTTRVVDRPDEVAEVELRRRLRSILFTYRLKRTRVSGRRRYFWVDTVSPISYAPWKRRQKLQYSLMMRARHGRIERMENQIEPLVLNEYEEVEVGQASNELEKPDFDTLITQFCQQTDFIALHKLTTIFPESPKIQRDYEKIEKGWKNLWPISSASSSCFLSSQDSSFLHPGCIFFSRTTREDTPIVIDTGASTSVSPYREDFVTFTESRSTVTGIGSKGVVEGHGSVRWSIYDSNGNETVIETAAIYMPAATVRLYSPQAHFRKHQKGSMFVDCRGIKLLFPHDKKTFSFPFHEPSVLPLMLDVAARREHHSLYLGRETLEPHCYSLSEILAARASGPVHDVDLIGANEFDGEGILSSIVDERNINLTGPQHELLAWHYRWGHASMWSIRKLIRPKDYDAKAHSDEISGVPWTMMPRPTRTKSPACPWYSRISKGRAIAIFLSALVVASRRHPERRSERLQLRALRMDLSRSIIYAPAIVSRWTKSSVHREGEQYDRRKVLSRVALSSWIMLLDMYALSPNRQLQPPRRWWENMPSNGRLTVLAFVSVPIFRIMVYLRPVPSATTFVAMDKQFISVAPELNIRMVWLRTTLKLLVGWQDR